MNINTSTFYKAFVGQDAEAKSQILNSGMTVEQYTDVSRCVNTNRVCAGSGLSYTVYQTTQAALAVFGRSDWQKATRALNSHAVVNACFDPELVKRYPDQHGRGVELFNLELESGLMSYVLEVLTGVSVLPSAEKLDALSYYDYFVRKNGSNSEKPLDRRVHVQGCVKEVGLTYFKPGFFERFCPELRYSQVVEYNMSIGMGISKLRENSSRCHQLVQYQL